MYDSLHPETASRPIGAMSACAVLASELDPKGRNSRIRTLRSDGPMVLRKCNPKGPEPPTHRRPDMARVTLAAGSIIAVDPGWGDTPPSADPFDRNAVLTPLAGPGIAIGAVAPDSLTLRRLLTAGLNTLGSPWAI